MKLIAKTCDGEVNKEQVYSTSIGLPIMYINQTANKFVAVGCNTIAKVSGEDNGWSYKTGCEATCNSLQDVANGNCSGIGCCQMNNIPIVTRNVDFELETVVSNRQHKDGKIVGCSYAFVVQKDEFHFSSDMLTHEWQVERMPMVIDWVIFNDTCSNPRSTCQGNTTCVPFEGPDNGYRCACEKGYEGNPYLHPGCLDIDECADDRQNDCSSKNATCLNTLGSYNCTCKEGYIDDGKGVALGMIVLLIAGFSLYLAHRRRKSAQMKEKFFRENGGLILQQRIAQGSASSGTTKIFTAKELEKATNNYDQTKIIGQGGFGIVYKGHLLDGRVIAVKKSKIMDPNQVEQFINEGAISFDGPELERNLSQHFLSSLKENKLFKILDGNILCEGSTIEELQEVALLAKRCLNFKGEDRPTMKEVAMELSGLRRAIKHPWANNSANSMESQALVMGSSIPLGYDPNFSVSTTGYDSIKDEMELPLAAGR
nr:putative wall-associated receptor kinase-like 16 [Ipomoea trifida]